MTLDDARLIWDYWQDHPPVHMMVAGYLGIKPRRPVAAAAGHSVDHIAEARTMASQLMAVPGMAQAADVHSDLGAPIFDFEKIRAMRPEPRKAQ